MILAFILSLFWGGFSGVSEFSEVSKVSEISGGLETEFLAGIQNNGNKFNTINCNFRQTKQLPYLTSPAKSTGKFHYKNGEVSILYDQPKGDCIIMNEKQCKTVVNGKSQTISTNSQPALKQIYQIIQASVSGNMKIIFDVFNVDVSENGTTYRLKLTPKQKNIKLDFMEMDFEKSDYSLSMLRIVKAENDFTKYEFFQKKFSRQ